MKKYKKIKFKATCIPLKKSEKNPLKVKKIKKRQ